MKILVHDTGSAMVDLLELPLADRPAALREMYEPLTVGWSVLGELDLVQMHRGFSGFKLDVDDPRFLPALKEMEDRKIWQQLEDRLAEAGEQLRNFKHAETVHVVLVLGDPDDEHLTVRSAGYFGLGGFPGAIHLTMWPTETSLRKIGYTAAHELHHNVRYANVRWDPVAVTVGEQVVAEGLAEAFVRELFGEQAMGPWAASVSDAVYEKVVAGIDVAGMQNLNAYVLGDAAAELSGQKPVGLPDFAGYGAGLRIVDAHLAVSGVTAAQSVALPAREILCNAGVPTNA
jgi:uncharacterized protein YjaZ